MRIQMRFLEQIASGAKTVEIRVAYPANRSIRPGQQLTFISGTRNVVTHVRDVRRYDSFAVLAEAEDPVTVGCASTADLLAALRELYPPHVEQLGVLAISIELAATNR